MSKIWLLILLLMPLMSDIDDLIESMQSVSDNERFRLMNQFKEEVIQLQEKERMEAMKKVISITQSSQADKVLEEAKDSEVDDSNESIDHAIETSDIAGVQESMGENNEIETDEVDEHD